MFASRFLKTSLFTTFLSGLLLASACRPCNAEGGFSPERCRFWGVLASHAELAPNQWVPFALYPNPRMAAAAVTILQRHGLSGRAVEGIATPAELIQHGRTAERGRLQLWRLVSREQVAQIQQDFGTSEQMEAAQRQTIQQAGFSSARRNTINNAGFDPIRRSVINDAGFDQGRRNTINNAGFDPVRRQTINTSRFPLVPRGNTSTPSSRRGNFGTQGQVSRSNRGTFGTQGQATNRNRGTFGTQSQQQSNARRGNFGTQ